MNVQKTKEAIKKEIVRVNSFDTGALPNWITENMQSLLDRGVEKLEKGEAKSVEHAAFLVIDECH